MHVQITTYRLQKSDSDNEKAEHFNLYFWSVFTPSQTRTVDFNIPAATNVMPEVEFAVSGILNQLRNLDTTKSTGPDDIPGCILKSCSGSLCLYFNVLFQKLLCESSLPLDWKLARVMPMHKSGPRASVENY